MVINIKGYFFVIVFVTTSEDFVAMRCLDAIDSYTDPYVYQVEH